MIKKPEFWITLSHFLGVCCADSFEDVSQTQLARIQKLLSSINITNGPPPQIEKKSQESNTVTMQQKDSPDNLWVFSYANGKPSSVTLKINNITTLRAEPLMNGDYRINMYRKGDQKLPDQFDFDSHTLMLKKSFVMEEASFCTKDYSLGTASRDRKVYIHEQAFSNGKLVSGSKKLPYGTTSFESYSIAKDGGYLTLETQTNTGIKTLMIRKGSDDSAEEAAEISLSKASRQPDSLKRLSYNEKSMPSIKTLSVTEIKKALDERIIGHDEEKRFLAVESFKYLEIMRAIQEGKQPTTHPLHGLLAGPSGCGKTYLIEVLAEIIGIPFVRLDITQITPQGISGDSFKTSIQKALKESDGKCAIIFCDEMDKRAFQPNITSEQKFLADAVQNEMLTLMNGTENYYWFMLAGAFAFAHPKDKPLAVSDLDGLLKPELRGRIGAQFVLKNNFTLDECKKMLISDKKGIQAIIQYYSNEGITIAISDSILTELAKSYMEKPPTTGIRGYINEINQKLNALEFDLLSKKEILKGKTVQITDVSFFTTNASASDRIKKYVKGL
jgi:ATP-dependent protease Clp ATPase subunit